MANNTFAQNIFVIYDKLFIQEQKYQIFAKVGHFTKSLKLLIPSKLDALGC